MEPLLLGVIGTQWALQQEVPVTLLECPGLRRWSPPSRLGSWQETFFVVPGLSSSMTWSTGVYSEGLSLRGDVALEQELRVAGQCPEVEGCWTVCIQTDSTLSHS